MEGRVEKVILKNFLMAYNCIFVMLSDFLSLLMFTLVQNPQKKYFMC